MCGRVLATIFIAAAAFSSPAWADDDESEPKAEEPDYTAEALIFVQDSLRFGWELIDDEDELPNDIPTEDQLTEIAGDDAFDLTVEYRLIEHQNGSKAVVAMIDVEIADGPHAFRKALDAQAAKCGWSVKELAHPTRLLVVAGQPADVQTLTKWQVEEAAKTLCEMAYVRLIRDNVGGAPGKLTRARATEYADAADSLVPGIGGALMIRGLFRIYDGKFDEAFALINEATEGGPPIAPPDGLVVFALALQARLMLALRRADLDVQSVDVLKRAVDLQSVALEEADRLEEDALYLLPFQNWYFLAVSYARLEKPDLAFEALQSAMALGKKILQPGVYLNQFRVMWFWDPDFEELRKDARFEEFSNRFAPAGFDFLKEREAAEEQKERIEKAQKEAEEKKKEEEARQKAKEEAEGREKKKGDK